MNKIIRSVVSSSVIDQIIEKNKGNAGILLSTLEEVQEIHPQKFLPAETLTEISEKLDIPRTQVYSVATFYSFFNLKPQGKNTIVVCRGTACHTKGSKALLEEIAPLLGISKADMENESSFTTPDYQYSIKTVACFGQCAQSPVVEVNANMYSNVDSHKLRKILSKVNLQQKTKARI